MSLPGVLAVARPSGAAMFIGGFFDTVNGSSHPMIAKLLADGSPDPDFVCVLDDEVFSLYHDEGRNRLWVGGAFTTVNGVASPYLAVVNSLTGALIANPQADGIVAQMVADEANGWLYLAGDFTQLDNAAGTWRVGRFDLGGTALDLTWQPATSAASRIHAVGIMGDDVLLGGRFTTLNGVARANAGTVGRTTPLVTQSFDPNFGGVLPDIVGFAFALGQVYIAGDFATADGNARDGLCKADPAGGGSAIDVAWAPTYAPGLRKFGITPNGTLGDMWAYGEATGPTAPPVVLLASNGVIDGSFNVAGTVGLFCNDVKRLPGRPGIYVATQSANNSDTLSQRVFRLGLSGAIDTSFAPITGGSPRQYVRCMALLGGA